MNPTDNEVWLRAATAALTGMCSNEQVRRDVPSAVVSAGAAHYADAFLAEWQKRQLPAVEG